MYHLTPQKSNSLNYHKGCFLFASIAPLNNFKFESQFFAAKDSAEIKLPEFASEPHARPALIEIDQQFQTEGPPEVGQRYVREDRFQLDVGIERKKLAVVHKAVERIAVEVISMRRVSRPIRV
jgi:hypothetical protein